MGPNSMKGDSSGLQCYEGIRVRSLPVPVSSPCQMVVGTNTTQQTPMSIATLASTPTPITIGSNLTPAKVLPAQQRSITAINPLPDSTALDNSLIIQKSPAPASPILKAQLSAPPKPPTPNQAQNPVTKIDSKSQVGPNPHSQSHSVGSSIFFFFFFTNIFSLSFLSFIFSFTRYFAAIHFLHDNTIQRQKKNVFSIFLDNCLKFMKIRKKS